MGCLKSFSRSRWEEDQLKTMQDRVATLAKIVDAESLTLRKLEAAKTAVEAEIEQAEEAITGLNEELSTVKEALDMKTQEVDQVKRAANKANKVLENALKEVTSMVGISIVFTALDLTA